MPKPVPVKVTCVPNGRLTLRTSLRSSNEIYNSDSQMGSPYPIFISYRRDDSERDVEHLYRDLSARLGRGSVFYDKLIPLGESYSEDLLQRIREAKVVLVVIARNWLPELKRRQDARDDLVRLEVKTALESTVRVIPILIDEKAIMPDADELPPEITRLAARQAFRIVRWEEDVAELARQLKRRIRPRSPRFLAAAIVTAAVVAIGAAAVISLPFGKEWLLGHNVTESATTNAATTTNATTPTMPISPLNLLRVPSGTGFHLQVSGREDQVIAAASFECGGKKRPPWRHAQLFGGVDFQVHENCAIHLILHAMRPEKVTVTMGQAGIQAEPLTISVADRVDLTWLITVTK